MNTTVNDEVSFETTKEEAALISKIAKRAKHINKGLDLLTTVMDLTACHCCGFPLDLQRLLEAKEADFLHDIYGINRHLCHDTGQLKDCFLPRFHARQTDTQVDYDPAERLPDSDVLVEVTTANGRKCRAEFNESRNVWTDEYYEIVRDVVTWRHLDQQAN